MNSFNIVYSHGRSGRYLELPAGKPHLNILKMARDDVQRELRMALNRAAKDWSEVVARTCDPSGRARPACGFGSNPFAGRRRGVLFLVTFEELAAQPSTEAGPEGLTPRIPRRHP